VPLSDDRAMLLIGASGFVGAHVLETARQAGLRVIPAGRDATNDLHCDLLDSESVAACVTDTDPAWVVNMAGAASVAASWDDPVSAFAINATGVLHLLEAVAQGAPGAHVLCASSAEVYGESVPAELPFTEDQPMKPVTPYGVSKAAMEVLCGQYARGRGLRIAVIRSFNQLGPGQSSAFAAAGFAHQIAAAEAAADERVELAVGNLSAARDFTDVRDTARALVEASRRELVGTYNLCSGVALTLRSLVEKMAEETPLPLEIKPDTSLSRPADPAVVYGSASRLHQAVGWTPEIPIERTAADLLDWWRARLAAA
jgi:GDP-4-dehydro-6-deoxy-D-mannose reductase